MSVGIVKTARNIFGAITAMYDCTTCPYPRYKDGSIIFCDVCIKKILDEQNEKKRRKEQPDGE